MPPPRSDANLPPAVRKRLRELESQVSVLTAAVGMLGRDFQAQGLTTVGVPTPAVVKLIAGGSTPSGKITWGLRRDPHHPAEPKPELKFIHGPHAYGGVPDKGVHLKGHTLYHVASRAAKRARAAKLLLLGTSSSIEPAAPPPVPGGPPSLSPSRGGLKGAALRGEAAMVNLVVAGELIPAEHLANAWGLTRQALSAAAQRGEVSVVKVSNRVYCPAVFLALPRESVSQLCRALGSMEPMEKFIFWTREHGALGGKTVAAALESGRPLGRVVQLAQAWALERGVGVNSAPEQVQSLAKHGAEPGAPG